jgi:hypothetical protein
MLVGVEIDSGAAAVFVTVPLTVVDASPMTIKVATGVGVSDPVAPSSNRNIAANITTRSTATAAKIHTTGDRCRVGGAVGRGGGAVGRVRGTAIAPVG